LWIAATIRASRCAELLPHESTSAQTSRPVIANVYGSAGRNNMERYARECIRIAEMTDDPQVREQLLRMAREWMALAAGDARCAEVLLPPVDAASAGDPD